MNSEMRTAASPYLTQWLILCLALLVLGFVVGHGVYKEYRQVQRGEEERLATQTNVVGRILGNKLTALDTVLDSLRRDWVNDAMRPGFNHRLEILVEGMAGVRTLVLFNAEGDIVACSNPGLIGKNFSERAYFQELKNNPDPYVLFIATPFRSVLDNAFLVPVEKVMPGADGSFNGIVAASLDPEFFAPLLLSVNYAPDMWMSLATSDGVLFMMEPLHDPDVLGMNIAQPGSFFTQHLQGGREVNVASGTVLATGQRRLGVTRSVQPRDLQLQRYLVVAATRDASAVFAHWRGDFLRNALLFSLLAVVSILGLWLYQRRHRELSRARLEAEERTRLLLTSLSEGVYGMDAGGRITFINPAGVELLGYAHPDELLGRNGHDVMHHSHPDGSAYSEESCPLRRALLHNETVSCATEVFWRKDGSSFQVLYTGSPLIREGRHEGAVVAFADISERLQAEKQLRNARDTLEQRVRQRTEELHATVEQLRQARDQAESASRMKSDFLASVSHELRTPLNGIKGMQQLLRDTSLSEEQLDFLQEAEAAAARLLRMIDSVIQVTGLEQYAPSAGPASLSSVVEAFAQAVGPAAKDKGLAFACEIAEDAPQIVVLDTTLLHLALSRLGENAVKFTDQGSVTLRVGPVANGDQTAGLLFVLSDTGSGMSGEQVEAATQGLTQAGSALDRRHGGLGLGLLTARKAVALLGGELEFHSEPGQGTAVSLRLNAVACEQDGEVTATSCPLYQ